MNSISNAQFLSLQLNDAAKVHQEEPKAGIRKESISICVVLLPKSWWPQSGAKTTTKNKSLGRRSNSGRAGSTKSRGFFGSSKPGGNTGGSKRLKILLLTNK